MEITISISAILLQTRVVIFMKNEQTYTSFQVIVLITLRILIGWHLLYEGIAKVFNPYWSSSEFLTESKWILTNLFDWILSNQGILSLVDLLNEWGLILIGLGLIVGLFTKTAALFGAILLLLYYLATPPLLGMEYSIPVEGNYLIISKTLIESVTMILLALFPTGEIFGMDLLVKQFKEKKFRFLSRKDNENE